MLMDILMEALMSMDDDTLDSVLESCDSEELEIIDSAMEQMNLNKLERKHAKAEGEAVAKWYGTKSIKYGSGLNTKEDKDVYTGRDIADKVQNPDHTYPVYEKDMSKARNMAAQIRKHGGGSFSSKPDEPHASARGYAFDRAIGRRAAYDAGIKAQDKPAPVYKSKKAELVDRLKNTKRYQEKYN